MWACSLHPFIGCVGGISLPGTPIFYTPTIHNPPLIYYFILIWQVSIKVATEWEARWRSSSVLIGSGVIAAVNESAPGRGPGSRFGVTFPLQLRESPRRFPFYFFKNFNYAVPIKKEIEMLGSAANFDIWVYPPVLFVQ